MLLAWRHNPWGLSEERGETAWAGEAAITASANSGQDGGRSHRKLH